jgi:hypothetical protein
MNTQAGNTTNDGKRGTDVLREPETNKSIQPQQMKTKQKIMKTTTRTFILGVAVLLFVSLSISARGDRSVFSFRSVIFPGDTFTQTLGINDRQKIAGYHGATVNQGFVFTFPDNFASENFPGSAQTQVIGINNQDSTDGFYIDLAGTTHGFLDIRGTFTTVDFPGTTFNQLLGLNEHNQAAGYYADAANIDHPYIFDKNGGVFLEITIPGATGGAQATGISDRGSISGFYIDSAGVNHGFLIADGELTTLDFPLSTFTQALGLNDHGDVVGAYMDAGGLTHGFIFDRGHFQSVDDPEGVGNTTINGINNRGEIVGFFVDGAGNTDGFVGFPSRR